jgi:predicted RNA-binding Zn-ribbon protein involved in translation (DUF1610 family)
MSDYLHTDTAVLDVRPCPDCGYDIHPGYTHGRIPQPNGGSHVICALQRVQALRKFGPCTECGVDAGEWWVDGIGMVKSEHYGPVGDDHDPKPGSLPLGEMLNRYLDHVGSRAPWVR